MLLWSQRSVDSCTGMNLKAQASIRIFTCLSWSSLTACQSFLWRGPTSNKLPDGHLGLLNVESLLFTLPNRRNLNACLGAVLFYLCGRKEFVYGIRAIQPYFGSCFSISWARS